MAASRQSASDAPFYATSTPSAVSVVLKTATSIELGPNLNIANLLESVEGNMALPAQDIIRQKLAHLSPSSQAAATRELICQAHERTERVLAAVYELWTYACDHELWRQSTRSFASEQEMRTCLSEEAALDVLLTAHRELERRRLRYSKKLLKSWKIHDLDMVIPANYRPNSFSKTLLAALVKLSAREELSHCRAIDLLILAINSRVKTPGQHKTPCLETNDVLSVLRNISAPDKLLQTPPSAASTNRFEELPSSPAQLRSFRPERNSTSPSHQIIGFRRSFSPDQDSGLQLRTHDGTDQDNPSVQRIPPLAFPRSEPHDGASTMDWLGNEEGDCVGEMWPVVSGAVAPVQVYASQLAGIRLDQSSQAVHPQQKDQAEQPSVHTEYPYQLVPLSIGSLLQQQQVACDEYQMVDAAEPEMMAKSAELNKELSRDGSDDDNTLPGTTMSDPADSPGHNVESIIEDGSSDGDQAAERAIVEAINQATREIQRGSSDGYQEFEGAIVEATNQATRETQRGSSVGDQEVEGATATAETLRQDEGAASEPNTEIPSQILDINVENHARTLVNPNACGCHPDVTGQNIWNVEGTNPRQAIQSLKDLMRDCAWDQICRIHTMELVKLLGLRQSGGMTLLIGRMDEVCDHEHDMEQFIDAHASWFLSEHHSTVAPQKATGYQYRFPNNKQGVPGFNADALLDSLLNPTQLEQWGSEGIVIVPRFFDFLLGSTDVQEIEELISGMYAHHKAKGNLTATDEGSRIYYSPLQQIQRQDPLGFCLKVALSPNSNWRLVSFPSSIQRTPTTQPSGHLRLDLPLRAHVDDNDREDQISASVMLDDETNLGCTTMVRGFHNHIIEWCIKLRNERRTIIPARTTDCTSLYNRSDRARFGEPEGVPCKRGDLRLMMPSIIYGSRTQGQPTGRAIQAHYIGIKADGITLEHEGLPSLSSLGGCHRQRQTPNRTAYGERNPDSVGDQTFPATSLISGVSAVGDALQGLRSWDDWEVVEERNVLLGPNRQAAELRINETRKKLVEAYKCAVHKIERLERAAFGANSYFVGLAKAKKAHRTQAHKGQDAIIIE